MAILNNAVVNGSIRCLNKIYAKDLALTGSMSVPSLTVSGTSTLSGAVTMGSTLTVPGAVVFSKVQSVSGTQFNSPALTVGGTSAQKHLEFAYDEIQAKSNATSTGSLYLNYRGGSVYLSGDHTIYASASTFYSPNIQSTGTITAGKLIADNAVILDTLRATKYSIDSISAVGGSLYVSPTIIFSSSATVTISSIDNSTNTVTGYISDSSSIKSDSIGGVQWTQYSKIKVSGRLGSVVLSESGGTISGYLTQKLNTTSGRLDFNLTFSDANQLTAQTYSAANVHDLRIMIYERGNGAVNNTYPVGILLTGYGYNSSSARDNSSYIDIYQGEASRTKPRIRLGKLDGIDTSVFSTDPIGDISSPTTPTGWGLFADNVFLRGVIFAKAGSIGGWTMTKDRFYYTSNVPASNSIVLSPSGVSSSTSIGGSSGTNTWALTVKNVFGVTTGGALYSTSGKIGGWNIGATSIYKAIDGQYRVYLYAPGTITGTTGAIGVETINSSGTSTGQVFQVRYDGSIFATKGTIAGWNITTNRFSKATSVTSGTANQTQYEMLFDAPTSITPASTYAFLLRQRSYDGSNYGDWTRVTSLYYNGQFYSNDAIIEGSITAKSGQIGRFNISYNDAKTGLAPSAGGHLYPYSLWTQQASTDNYVYEAGIRSTALNDTATGNLGSTVFYVKKQPKDQAWTTTTNSEFIFYVLRDGTLRSTKGYIGGWTIDGTSGLKNNDNSIFLAPSAKTTDLGSTYARFGSVFILADNGRLCCEQFGISQGGPRKDGTWDPNGAYGVNIAACTSSIVGLSNSKENDSFFVGDGTNNGIIFAQDNVYVKTGNSYYNLINSCWRANKISVESDGSVNLWGPKNHIYLGNNNDLYITDSSDSTRSFSLLEDTFRKHTVGKGSTYTLKSNRLYIAFIYHSSTTNSNGVYMFRGGSNTVIPIKTGSNLSVAISGGTNFSWSTTNSDTPTCYLYY